MVNEVASICSGGRTEAPIVAGDCDLNAGNWLVALIGDKTGNGATSYERQILIGNLVGNNSDENTGGCVRGRVHALNRDRNHRNISKGVMTSGISLHRAEQVAPVKIPAMQLDWHIHHRHS